MKKRGWAVLLAAVMILLLAAGCGEQGKGKILSTEGVPQEVLQSALYKAALAEETATVIAYNSVPLTDSAPLRAAVEKMQAGEDAVLTYYEIDTDGRCWAWRLTMKDGVASYQSTRTEDWNSAIDWENVLYRQAGEIKLNSCGYLSFGEEGPAYAPLYWVFSPLDTYDGYNERYELTKTYLKPLWAQGGAQFSKPEDITDPWTWMFFYDGMTGEYEGYHEGGTMPTQEVVNLLVSRFEISEQKLRSLLDPDGDGSIEWIEHGGIAPQYFAKEAVQEGDLLRIRFGLLPDSDGSEPIYDRELTVLLAEDGSWKYVSNLAAPIKLENGVTALNESEALRGSSWQALYTCRVPDGDGYNRVFETSMKPVLLENGTLAVPVIQGISYKDGAPIAVMMLHTDGSYNVIETPLTCGEWMRRWADDGINWFNVRTKAENNSLVIYSEKGNNYKGTSICVEVQVWEDGRVESHPDEWKPYNGIIYSPDGNHSADIDADKNLLIDGVIVDESILDRGDWKYGGYYGMLFWLDNDRLLIKRYYHTGVEDYGVYCLSTGKVEWLWLPKSNWNGADSPQVVGSDRICWLVLEQIYTGDNSDLSWEDIVYSMPLADFPNGEWSREVSNVSYCHAKENNILWGYNWQNDNTTAVSLCAYDAATGENALLSLSMKELGGSGWYIDSLRMMEQGAVLRCYQYAEGTGECNVWIVTVPRELLDTVEWRNLPSILDTAEVIALTEIEETFAGHWKEEAYSDGAELVIYREGSNLYSKWENGEPQQLMKAYKTGKTGYYITTQRANGTTDVLVLDTGKPKDNKVYFFCEWQRELTYLGEA